MTVLDYARRYLDAGISIIPIRRGGDKEPASDLLPWVWDEDRAINRRSWKPFQDEPVTLTEAVSWWRSAAPPGIAAVGGAISGGLEVLDFDRLAEELFAGWCEMVEAEHPGLVGRLCVVQTPRQPAGYHVWLRCPDIETPGNTKLAIDPTVKGKERTLIETRGKGGYALVPGCPPECHPSGGTYEHVAGPALWDLGTVSMDEHEDLMSCARALSREVQEEHSPSHAHPSNGELLPGQDFDRRGPDWSEILTPHGWTLAGKAQGGERRWRRPGKDHGWSATTGFCRAQDGADLLRVFSSNAHPLEDGKAYGKFRALSLLNFGGSWSGAASALSRMGYGERRGKETRKPSAAEVDFILMALEMAGPVRVRKLLGEVGHE